MKTILIVLVCLGVAGTLALARSHSNSHHWSLFKQQHKKHYSSPEEEARRFATFMNTKARVERHNADKSSSYKMGLNHLADWQPEELAKLNGFKFDPKMLERELSAEHEAYLNQFISSGKPLPSEVDWRKVPRRVSKIKDQGMCGSCWAFSTTGLLEGQEVVRNLTNKLVRLSEQDLVDCSSTNKGCDGGVMENALNDIKRMGGIDSECDYPYMGEDQTCRFNKSTKVLTDSGAILLPQGDEAKLKEMVANYGPVATAMFASQNFQGYEGGIFEDSTCKEGKLNHGVLIVGYGTDSKDGDFWIIKNSWSKLWGDAGYGKIRRGKNMCGIAYVPTIAKF